VRNITEARIHIITKDMFDLVSQRWKFYSPADAMQMRSGLQRATPHIKKIRSARLVTRQTRNIVFRWGWWNRWIKDFSFNLAEWYE